MKKELPIIHSKDEITEINKTYILIEGDTEWLVKKVLIGTDNEKFTTTIAIRKVPDVKVDVEKSTEL